MTLLTLVVGNLRSAKLRVLLLSLSFVISFCTFGVLMAFERAFNAEALTDVGRMISVNKISFTQPLPYAHFNRLRSIPGVGEATFASWFGGYFQEPGNRLHAFAVDHSTYLDVYREDILISEPEQQIFLRERTALLVGEAMAAKWRWKVGDQVPVMSNAVVQTSGSRTWTFVVAGIFKAGSAQVDTNFMFLRHDYLNQARVSGRDTIGWMVFRPTQRGGGEDAGEAVDLAFETEADQTATDTERNFNRSFVSQFGDVALATRVIVAAALVSVLMIAVNIMMLSVRQRVRQIGILKALGFPRNRIVQMLFVETLIITFAGGFLGLAAAYAALLALGPGVTQIAPGMRLGPGILLLAIGLAVGLAAIATAGPAYFSWRLKTADALRRH